MGTKIHHVDSLSYYLNQIKNIDSLVHAIPEAFDQKAIHELRVELKKLQAFYELLEISSKKGFNAWEAQMIYKEVFQKSGKLREKQVNPVLLKKLNLTKSLIKKYQDYTKASIDRSKVTLQTALKEIDLSRKSEVSTQVKEIRRKTDSKEFQQLSTKYIKRKSRLLRKLALSNREVSTVQKIRVNIKKAGHILLLLREIQLKKVPKKLTISLEKTESLIDQWHDGIVLLESLKKFIRKDQALLKEEKAELRSFISGINRRNERFLKKLYPELNQTLDLIFKYF